MKPNRTPLLTRARPVHITRLLRSLLLRGRVYWPLVLSFAFAAGIAGYALSLPDVLTGVHGYTGHGYDDGVYFGAAINLIHGSIAYRDFVMVQPPGIAILMSPLALIGQLIGERDAFALTRCLGVLVAGSNAALVAMLLRGRGKVAMVIGGFAMAFFPLSVAADHTLMLEPYLTLFCLLGLLFAFMDGKLSAGNRLLAAGIMFGVAGTIKLWAIFPIVAIVALAIRSRRSVRHFVPGCAAGLLVPFALFFFAAPTSFMHDVFFAQGGRVELSSFGSQLGNSLSDISGLSGLGTLSPPSWVAVLVTCACGIAAAAVIIVSRTHATDFDRFILFATALVVVGMLLSTQFVPHYAYFTAAFLALLIGTTISLIGSEVSRRVGLPSPVTWRTIAPAPLICFLVAALVLVAVLVHTDVGYTTSYLSLAEDDGAAIAAVIPAGSCVISDQVSYLIDANRLTPAQSSCPPFLDWYGTWLADDPSSLPPSDEPYGTSIVNAWTAMLTRADYLVLFSPSTEAYPRTPQTAALISQYRLVYSAPGTYAYCHVARVGSSTQIASASITAGLAAENHQDDAAAIANYNTALINDPCNVTALYDLGTVRQALGDNSGAITIYEEVLDLSPGYAPAQTNLSYLQGVSG